MLRLVRTTTTLPLVRNLIVDKHWITSANTQATYRLLLSPSSPTSLKNCLFPCMRRKALTPNTPAP